LVDVLRFWISDDDGRPDDPEIFEHRSGRKPWIIIASGCAESHVNDERVALHIRRELNPIHAIDRPEPFEGTAYTLNANIFAVSLKYSF
jgi:hypothetical protein